MTIRFQGGDERLQQAIPRTRTDKVEIFFSNGKSLRRQLPPDESDEQIFQNAMGGDGRQLQVRVMAAGQDDVTYTDHNNSTVVEQRELGTKNFLIADSVTKLNWKLTGETRKILGYDCQQATAQRISTRFTMSMSNGEATRQEVQDTANITAWFTTAVPVSVSPDFAGQLPGLVLAIDINNGRTVYKALEVSPKVDMALLKEPTKGKKVTRKEFDEERNKLMKEMQMNIPNTRGTVRFSN